ncbi:MAG: SusC/RagA family TonB-linked outer membrane protein, partial [Flectobacillus sp.]|nr:SusC/RagA family TonB-linked outer membrane protein [Flectobacillus sp.]
IKGGKGGATTNGEGNFKLDLPTGNETLVISMVGYKTKEVSVSGRSVVNIVLEDNTAAIDEVIVVGYGEQKKIHATGAIATVDMKSVEDLAVTSLGAAIVAQMPGVGISGGYNRPGVAPTITIRNPINFGKDNAAIDGTTNSNNPLYVIDGVIRTPEDFNNLDVSEVENVSVLKDAAAAVYGSRGANGVIIATTKRGKSGAPKFTYSSTFGLTDAYSHAKVMNAYQLATYINDYNYKTTTPAVTLFAEDELEHFKGVNYNWLDDAWKAALQTRQTLNISGGSDRATYFASVSYNNQNGNFDKINYDKWTFRASTDVKAGKNLKFGLSVSGDISKNEKYLLKQGGSNEELDYQTLIEMAPFRPAYVNGYPINPMSGTNFAGQNNVLTFHFFEAQNSNNYTRTKANGINVNASAEYDVPFIKGLKARVNYNLNQESSYAKEFGTSLLLYDLSMEGSRKHIYAGTPTTARKVVNGSSLLYDAKNQPSYTLNGSLSYNRDFGKHSVSALALFEQNEYYQDYLRSSLSGLIDGASDNASFSAGTTQIPAGFAALTESQRESGRLAYVGRINYTYADKYLAEISVRRDASTNFIAANRWGTFPSLSLGWVMSKEKFFNNAFPNVDLFKIRASAGLLGQDNTKPYMWAKSYELIRADQGAVFGGNNAINSATFYKVAMPNPDLRWDDNLKLNFGIDMTTLKSRLSFNLDAFYDRRFNMISEVTAAAPLTIGLAIPSENFGEVESFGYEISLGWKDYITKDWSYSIKTGLSWSDNYVVNKSQASSVRGTLEDAIGRSSDIGFLGYKTVGILRTQSDLDALFAKYPSYTIEGTKPELGSLYFEDVRGLPVFNADGTFKEYGPADGKITKEDRVVLSDRAGNNYGLNLNFSTKYKNLSFSFNAGGSFGGVTEVETVARGWNNSNNVNFNSNLPEFLVDHWTVDNPNATYPAPIARTATGLRSDFWMLSGFTASIRNANVSYELPKAMASKLGVGNVRVYLTSNNPLNLIDPFWYKDFSGQYNRYPTLRSFSGGINLSF